MRVQIDASREDDLASCVDRTRPRPDLADRGDPRAADRNVRATLAVRGDDEPAAYG
jgi:hypothetical protein